MKAQTQAKVQTTTSPIFSVVPVKVEPEIPRVEEQVKAQVHKIIANMISNAALSTYLFGHRGEDITALRQLAKAIVCGLRLKLSGWQLEKLTKIYSNSKLIFNHVDTHNETATFNIVVDDKANDRVFFYIEPICGTEQDEIVNNLVKALYEHIVREVKFIERDVKLRVIEELSDEYEFDKDDALAKLGI